MGFNIQEASPERIRLEQRYEELKLLRSSSESTLIDVQKYVRPNGTGFEHSKKLYGETQRDGSKLIYDHTAVWANQMFANGLTSYLVPKAERWAYLKPTGIPSSELSDEQLLYLEQVSDQIYHRLSLPQSKFYQAAHETFFDQGSYGTSVVYAKPADHGITFRACPLADCFFDVNDEDNVDTLYYRKFLRTPALIRMFPKVLEIDGFDPKANTKQYEVVYAVEPNVKANGKGRIGSERPYKATYWCPDFKELLDEGHISYFPFLVPRWTVVSGEIMGRSPAMTCLSNIIMLNKMKKEVLKSAEQANSPTMTAEEDTILLPLKYGARQMIWRERGAPPPEPINSGVNPGITLEMMAAEKDDIVRSFFVDQIMREQKKERQTIMEIQDERGQMLQQLGPLLARQENEFVGPAIELTFDILSRKKLIPEPPESLAGAELEIVYTSPAAYAQFASRISDISAFMQDITPMAQADPTIMENIDQSELLDAYSRYRNIPRRIIKSKKDVEEIRNQRKQTEEAQMAAQMAPQMAGAMKDVAQAKQSDPEGMGQLLNM